MAAPVEPPQPAFGRIPQIDVLRGLAALGVFVFHVSGVLGFSKKVLPPFDLFGRNWSTIPSVFSLGAVGVSLFFVVSGFCLALQPLARGATSVNLRRYYRDRVARIYPAYFIAVVFSAAVTTLLAVPWSGWELVTFLAFFQGFVHLWAFSFNGALWSMATEVQFYLVFPLLLVLLVRAGRHQFLLASVLAVVAARLAFTHAQSAAVVIGGITTSAFLMNNLPGRLLEFVAGMVVANVFVVNRHRLWRWGSLAVLPAVALGLWARAFAPLWLVDPLVGLMFAMVLACAVCRFYFISEASLLARFGRMSYSFFLLHFPVLALIAHWAGWLVELPPYTRFLTLFALGLLATLPLGLLLYRYVEIPMWRRFRI